ncbi:MAG TPA: hypothetical protein DEQ14_02410 [Treponema sp.]|nr:hypothetical protein [Treponema sp.]
MKKICMMFGLIFFTVSLYAVSFSELLIIAEDRTFLGTFENKCSSNSIFNKYGDKHYCTPIDKIYQWRNKVFVQKNYLEMIFNNSVTANEFQMLILDLFKNGNVK